jgi:opacity protein-like surface antigen
MKNLLLVATAFCASAGAAHAASLDFTAFPAGLQGTTTLVLPHATVSTPDGGDLFVGDTVANSICAIKIATFSCAADLKIDFDEAVTNLVFDVHGAQSGDSVTLNIFDGDDSLLDTLGITTNGEVDLSVYGPVGGLLFDDNSTSAGVSYGDITFDVDVPAPAALSLFGFGLMTIAARRRRRA